MSGIELFRKRLTEIMSSVTGRTIEESVFASRQGQTFFLYSNWTDLRFIPSHVSSGCRGVKLTTDVNLMQWLLVMHSAQLTLKRFVTLRN